MSHNSDYGSAARSLAINEPSPPSTPTLERGRPSWQRRQSTASLFSSGRPRNARERAMQQIQPWVDWGLGIWRRLPWWQRIAGATLVIGLNVLLVLFMVYNERILEFAHPYAEEWSRRPGGWLLVWSLIFVCGFPPLIGYSTMLTISGFVYGVWKGWLIAATANVAGSLCAFVVCRRFLRGWAERRLASHTQFQALALVFKHDGIKLLTMVRLCPLPYSASNGALSTFPTLTPQAFATATAMATPKLLIHCFMGSRLGKIGEGHMDSTTKTVNYLSVAFGAIIGILTGYLIYKRTQRRVKELEQEEQAKLEEREAALAHPDVFADDEDAQSLDDEAIRMSIEAHDDNDFLDLPGDAGRYKDDASDQGTAPQGQK